MTDSPPALKLTKAQIDKIFSLKPTWDKVEKLTGVPAMMIASVWMRESGSVAPPKTPGGPFQFDPYPTPAQMSKLFNSYTTGLTPIQKEDYIRKGVDDFETAAIFCGCFLRNKVKPKLDLLSPESVIMDAFYGYNGRVFGDVWRSSYVVNGFDKEHMNMTIRGTIPDGKGGRKKIVTTDKRPGTYSMYRQLTDLLRHG